MAEKDIATLVAEKIEGIKSEYAGLKSVVDASEQKVKDLSRLSEKLGDLDAKLADLSDIELGEKKVKFRDFVVEMQKQVNGLAEKIVDQSVSGKNKIKSVEQQMVEYFNGDQYKQMIELKKKGYKMREDIGFDIKSVVTLSGITPIGTDSIPFSLTAPLEPGVNKPNNNPTIFYDLISKGTTSKEYVAWLERNTWTRGAASRAENAQFPESAITWVEKKTDVKKIADSLPVTNESLEDIDYIMSEIMELLQFNIPNLRDGQIFNGDGTNNTLLGLTGTDMAKAFAKPSGVNSLQSADEYDVLATAILQVMLGNSAADSASIGYAPSGIVLNPIDFHNMKLLRDGENRFKYPDLWMPNPSIGGASIKLSTRQTVGAFLVADFGMAKYFSRRGMSIRMWDQNGNDPVYDRVTFTCSERGALRIKTHDKFAFVKGTFAAAKTELSNQA